MGCLGVGMALSLEWGNGHHWEGQEEVMSNLLSEKLASGCGEPAGGEGAVS